MPLCATDVEHGRHENYHKLRPCQVQI